MFEKVKQLNELRKQSKELEKQLQQDALEVVHKGVAVQVRGDMQLIRLDTEGKEDKVVMEAINKALKASQKESAKKMQGQIGDLSKLLG